MAHQPLKMTMEQAHQELEHAWAASYSAERNAEAIQAMSHKRVGPRIFHLIMRLAFRGIYFPQTSKREWVKVIFENRRTISSLVREVIRKRRMKRRKDASAYPIPSTIKQEF